MKIISGLFLLTAFATMLYLNIGQWAGVSMGIDGAKKEAADKLTNHNSTSPLTIRADEFASGQVFYTGQSEISYYGHMYDIAGAVKQGGEWILQVYHDEKEEGLLSSLREIVDGWFSNPQKNHSKQPSSKQIDLFKDFMPVARLTFVFTNQTDRALPLFYQFPAEAPLITVLKSPPQLG